MINTVEFLYVLLFTRLKRTEIDIRVIQSQGVAIFEVAITAARTRSAY